MIRIILQKDVINLGDAGDIKEVKDGYARNYLFPQNLAVRADKANTKSALHHKRLIEIHKDKRSKDMQAFSSQIEGKTLEIKVNVGENDKLYGTVTAIDIATALKKEGFIIDKRKIELAEHIKTLGGYKIKIKLAEGLQTGINVNVVKGNA